MRSVESGAFRNLPLRYLNFRNSDLTSLELGAFSELLDCTLDLSGNKLTTLARSVFAGAGLYRLDLSNNDIADISFLSGLRYAQEIDLSGNRIVEISPLMDIIHLQTLDLSKNRVVDVSPLADLADQLIELDISHNEVGDISPLLQNGPMSEDSVLYLHGNRLHGIAFDDHVAMLRSWGVKVLHARVWPGDSSALEGEQFEFSVHLSSEVGDPVSVNWQLVFAQDQDRVTSLGGVFLTAIVDDFGFGSSWGCGWGFCYRKDILAGGELTIGAMRRLGYASAGPAVRSSDPGEWSSEAQPSPRFFA